jgi:hypothetical protein
MEVTGRHLPCAKTTAALSLEGKDGAPVAACGCPGQAQLFAALLLIWLIRELALSTARAMVWST